VWVNVLSRQTANHIQKGILSGQQQCMTEGMSSAVATDALLSQGVLRRSAAPAALSNPFESQHKEAPAQSCIVARSQDEWTT
jgi:hypothetical protein